MRFLRTFFASLLAVVTVPASATDSPLKLAFAKSRAENNIDVILPVLRKSRLFVVTGGQSETQDYFLTSSPTSGRFCVTVAEQIEYLHRISWPKTEVTGEHLLRKLPANIEIVVVYPDGGDYITREHLQWYRSLLK
jgi:hypothetical protein